MNHPKIKGIGLTQFGELWDRSIADLLIEASESALRDARININTIEAIYIANMLAGETTGYSNIGSILNGHYHVNIPVKRIEAACASGGLAVYTATQAILHGAHKNVLVVGAEKMTDLPLPHISHLLMQAAGEDEREANATFPGLYALMAQTYMQKWGKKREDLAYASLISHRNACNNPIAQFQKSITIDDVLASSPVAEPLSLLDCSPITDGAAALVLSSEKPKTGQKEAFIIGSVCVSDTPSLKNRSTLTALPATQKASKLLQEKTGVRLNEIDVIEVHDCFSIAGIFAIEDIGFAKKGEGTEVMKKITSGGATLPIYNPSGGLKACGHPVGATGVHQIAEIALHLQGRAGARLVKNAQLGLTHNIAGTGAMCVMHLIGK